MNFTDETIKAELAVCEAATERPWEVIDGHIPQIEAVNKKRGVRPAGCPYPRIARMAAGYAPDERNAKLVVHACNNYEAALKELQILLGVARDFAPMGQCDRCLHRKGCSAVKVTPKAQLYDREKCWQRLYSKARGELEEK